MAHQPESLPVKDPLVSVIIPCYNVVDHIPNALDSIDSQSHSELEVICVDDGSTDDTVVCIEKWGAQNPSVQLVIVRQKNAGACAARNAGLKKSDGTYIQFLDADDILMPTKVEHQLSLFQGRSELSFVAGTYYRRNVSGERRLIEVPGADFLNVYCGNAGITSANLFRKSDLDKLKGWNEKLKSSQEADLMFRILLNGGKGEADDEALTEIRERDSGQISKSDPVRRLSNYLAVRTDMIDRVQKENPGEWERNRPKYQSFLLSTLLVLNRYEPDVWRDYAHYFPYKSELVPLAGLSKKNIRLIRLMGYTNYFKLAAKLKPKKI